MVVELNSIKKRKLVTKPSKTYQSFCPTVKMRSQNLRWTNYGKAYSTVSAFEAVWLYIFSCFWQVSGCPTSLWSSKR